MFLFCADTTGSLEGGIGSLKLKHGLAVIINRAPENSLWRSAPCFNSISTGVPLLHVDADSESGLRHSGQSAGRFNLRAYGYAERHLTKALPESTREFAQWLLALEAGSESTSESNEAVRVCEKLRVSLTRFAGPDGYTSLLRRALAKARIDFPALEAVEVGQGGQLEGCEKLLADALNNGTDAAVEVIAWLLALLSTFIGEPLTHGLVREAWPELPQEESQKLEAQ